MGEKAHDRWIVPLSRSLHDEQHRMNERTFWARYGIDPLIVSLALYGAYRDGDEDMARRIVLTGGRE